MSRSFSAPRLRCFQRRSSWRSRRGTQERATIGLGAHRCARVGGRADPLARANTSTALPQLLLLMHKRHTSNGASRRAASELKQDAAALELQAKALSLRLKHQDPGVRLVVLDVLAACPPAALAPVAPQLSELLADGVWCARSTPRVLLFVATSALMHNQPNEV